MLAKPATQEDVISALRGMPSGRASGPDDLTYEMFKAFIDEPELVQMMTAAVSILFTPQDLSDPRVTTAFKSAVTNLLPKPDKNDEELNLIQNLRPITLRMVFFKIFECT